MAEFKFGIGAILRHKGAAKAEDADILFVTERLTQQCPGGVQLFYQCRVITCHNRNTYDLVRFNEVELEDYPDRETTRDILGKLTSSVRAASKMIEALGKSQDKPETPAV